MSMSYDDSLKALRDIGILPFRVEKRLEGSSVSPMMFGTRAEACTYLNREADRLRKEFGEEVDNGVLLQTCDREEGEGRWMLSAWCDFPSDSEGVKIDPNRKPQFIRGERFGAQRLAAPSSKVFVWIGGRDCDGEKYGGVYEFDEIWEASEYTQQSQLASDGHENYGVITRDQFEIFVYGQ